MASLKKGNTGGKWGSFFPLGVISNNVCNV